MLDRKIAPSYKTVTQLNYLKPDISRLSNNLPVYTFYNNNSEIIKLDLIFNAGRWFQLDKLVASMTNLMLREDSGKYTSAQISEMLDYYGAHLSLHTEQDKAIVTLYCLNKYFPVLIELLADIILNPIFPDDELQILLGKKKEQFRIDSEKVKILAYRKFQQEVFPEDHPYGQVAGLRDFDSVKSSQLVDFHKKYYNAANCVAIFSGLVDHDIQQHFNQKFGGSHWQGVTQEFEKKAFDDSPTGRKIDVPRSNGVQTAIRMGRIMFNRTHSDYIDFRLLNTVLGGYFGSRLMSNIREDKGYTYGIGSRIVSYQRAGVFSITTETGSKNVEAVLAEIRKEIDSLKKYLIGSEELQRVKSYFVGDMLQSFDGPFATSESFRSVIEYDLDFDYFNDMLSRVWRISPERLLDLANKYLDFDRMHIVLAG